MLITLVILRSILDYRDATRTKHDAIRDDAQQRHAHGVHGIYDGVDGLSRHASTASHHTGRKSGSLTSRLSRGGSRRPSSRGAQEGDARGSEDSGDSMAILPIPPRDAGQSTRTHKGKGIDLAMLNEPGPHHRGLAGVEGNHSSENGTPSRHHLTASSHHPDPEGRRTSSTPHLAPLGFGLGRQGSNATTNSWHSMNSALEKARNKADAGGSRS